MATFVLVHSPLVGRSSWEGVAAELRSVGHTAVVPEVGDDPGVDSFWHRHAAGPAESLASVSRTELTVLVGHSGAGPLLPAIRALSGRPVDAYIFVDAGLPHDQQTRLDSFPPEARNAFMAELQAGARFPAWTDADLADLVPSDQDRRSLLAGMRPRGLDFFEEPVPVFAGWPDSPVGYLLFSAPYETAAQEAAAAGWMVVQMPGGHFDMLTRPAQVARALTGIFDSITGARR